MRKITGAIAASLCLCLAPLAHAGGNVQFSLSDATGPQGGQVLVQALMDNNEGEIQGWSFGVCDAAGSVVAVDAVAGATTATIKDGEEPDFLSLELEAGGVSTGVVIDFFSMVTLPTGTGYEIVDITYDLVGDPDQTYSVNYCDTLGAPPITTVYVIGGASLVPTQIAAAVTITNPNALELGAETGTAGSSVSVGLSLTNVVDVNALQCSIGYDDTLVTATGATPVGPAAAADFFAIQMSGPGELVFGLGMDLAAPFDGAVLPAGSAVEIVSIDWDIDAAAPAPVTASLSFVDGLGSPATDNLLIVGGGSSQTPGLNDGSIEILNFNAFIRGDCNDDNQIDIADGVFLINFLFGDGADPICDDACDSNDDADLNVADSIYIWNYSLLDGPAPLAPFPTADIDPTPGDGLGCDGDADNS